MYNDSFSHQAYEVERSSISRTYANGHSYAEWVHYKRCHEGGGCGQCWCCTAIVRQTNKGDDRAPSPESLIGIAELVKRFEDAQDLLKRGTASPERALAMVAMQAVRVIADRTGIGVNQLLKQALEYSNPSGEAVAA